MNVGIAKNAGLRWTVPTPVTPFAYGSLCSRLPFLTYLFTQKFGMLLSGESLSGNVVDKKTHPHITIARAIEYEDA